MNYAELTDDELRLEVARRCGYELRHGFMDDACINPKDYWITPRGWLTSILPDYPRYINAAYALEDALPVEQRDDYAIHLHDIVLRRQGVCADWDMVHASAADRCRAWLWTMEG